MNNNGVFATAFIGNNFGSRPNINTPPSCAVRLNNASPPVNNGSGWKVGARDILHEPIDIDLRVIDKRQAARHNLSKIVGRNIGRHSHGNARRPVDEKIGGSGGQDYGDLLGSIVIIDKVDRFFVQIGEQRMSQLTHANFGVTHSRG